MLMMLKMNQMMVMMWRACCRWPEDDDPDDDKNDDLEDNDDQNDGDDGDDEDDRWYREQVAGGPSGEERIGDVPEGAKRTRTQRETNANWDFGMGTVMLLMMMMVMVVMLMMMKRMRGDSSGRNTNWVLIKDVLVITRIAVRMVTSSGTYFVHFRVFCDKLWKEIGDGGRGGLGDNRVTWPCSTNTIQDFYTAKALQYNASIVSGGPVKEFQGSYI